MNNLNIDWGKVLKENFFYEKAYLYTENQLELFRISLSTFSLFSVLTLLLDFDLFFSTNGLINWEVSNANSYWFEIHPGRIANLFHIDPNGTVISILVLYIICLICLLAGVFTRFTAILSLLCFVCLSNVTATYGFGVDVYQTVCLFFLCIFPTGYSLSILKKKPIKDLSTIKMISIRVLQLYLCLTYISAGFEKAVMENWRDGSFIYYLVNDPTVMVVQLIPKDLPKLFYSFLGICVVTIESFYFIYVWIPIIRVIGVLFIICMHLFIAIYMDLFLFGLLLILLNIICWYPAILKDFKR